MSEAPKVFCKKEGKEVPIWWCLGSYFQQRPKCPHNEGAEIHYGKTARTFCLYPEVFVFEDSQPSHGSLEWESNMGRCFRNANAELM